MIIKQNEASIHLIARNASGHTKKYMKSDCFQTNTPQMRKSSITEWRWRWDRLSWSFQIFHCTIERETRWNLNRNNNKNNKNCSYCCAICDWFGHERTGTNTRMYSNSNAYWSEMLCGYASSHMERLITTK